MAGLGLIVFGLCAILAIGSDPTQACTDVYPTACPGWKTNGDCTNAAWKDFMKTYCTKTCGHCGSAASSPMPATTKPACSDVLPTACPGWKKDGDCTNAAWKDFMKTYCAKTCGHCGGGVTPPKPATTKPGSPPTPNPVTTKPGSTPSTPNIVTTAPRPTGGCGKPEVTQSRVIAGVNATRGAWPWQILMLFNGQPMCGGSLISARWVVTAAHCVDGYEQSPTYFNVRVGEHRTGTTSDGKHTDIQVEKIISHKNYSQSTIDSDIALMKLSTPVLFDKYVKPVCLPSKPVPVGTKCFITGWGKIKHPGDMHHTLQQGRMPVVSNADCTKMNTKNFGLAITDQMVCAGHGGSTRVSGCHGDSGGPFVCQTGAYGSWELHGAVSWGSGRCDATEGYTVFARVAKFRSWIKKQSGV